jgi:hypothetical protein
MVVSFRPPGLLQIAEYTLFNPPYEDKWRDMKSLRMDRDNHDPTDELMSLRVPIVTAGASMAVDNASIETFLLAHRSALDSHLRGEKILGTP